MKWPPFLHKVLCRQSWDTFPGASDDGNGLHSSILNHDSLSHWAGILAPFTAHKSIDIPLVSDNSL